MTQTAIRILATVIIGTSAFEALGSDDGVIRAHILCQSTHVNVGEPILVDFLIQNASKTEPAILSVHGTDPEVMEGDLMTLPIAHVFSGPDFSAINIRNEENRLWNAPNGYQPPAKAPIVALAPSSFVGTTIDIRRYYPALRSPGDYRITWTPYEGSIESNILLIRVSALKQAEIITDQGSMKVRFFYQDAPAHVQNFIDLAKKGFYNDLSFHRIATGYFIQGGCPNGDGTGIRPDGVKLEAELSNRPQMRGMISMALLDDDPDSASCQFFITNTRVPEWDGKYTTFGQLVGDESFKTLDVLMASPVDADNVPIERINIRAIRISEILRD